MGKFRIDPHRGVVCSRGHLVTEDLERIPYCGKCGQAFCQECFTEGAQPASCPGDNSCPNV